ncbi:MOSC domain-containing protein [Sarocladium implicatum]|nr:MOSC domain-containing protein [Sarocladium implicatum]
MDHAEPQGRPLRYNSDVENFREAEYPAIKDSIYLDHAGSALCSKSLMNSFAKEITGELYGNPHSASWPSQLSSARIDDTRHELLSFLRADPDEFDLVFVANATAGVKLIVDGFRSLPDGYGFIHHEACHTSIVGMREEALWTQCVTDESMRSWTSGSSSSDYQAVGSEVTLFAYSAQSHLDGTRYPLAWSDAVRENSRTKTYSLLDASSFCATSQLDLSDSRTAPDFVVLSLYKLFGFPDLGILLVRKSAEEVFMQRKYFGGGTVDMVVCGKQQWHAPKSQFLHERLEDGTLPFHNIIAANVALPVHKRLFGSMDRVASHTMFLADHLRRALDQLKHANGLPVAVQYGPKGNDNALGRGPIVAFNLRDSKGAWVSLAEFEKLANMKKICVRTGGMCSPGGIASALGLEPWEMRRNFSAGFRCGTDDDVVAGKPTGAIRASFGAMSTLSDATRFLDFLAEFFVETHDAESWTHEDLASKQADHNTLRVKSITVFPIKSCAGYVVPPGTPWEVRSEGLAWDREWCLVHRSSGHALSQKRYPNMALLEPTLDFAAGVLRVRSKKVGQGNTAGIAIPLAEDPSFFESSRPTPQARVCGDAVSMLTYSLPEINDFFSNVIGVPCALARFPAGGRGAASRNSKATMQSHQRKTPRLPGSFPGVPSPPDSDSETNNVGKILLSNESPILMIYSASVDELNARIAETGGTPVSDSSFRANIVIQSTGISAAPAAYAEDVWTALDIGEQRYRLLGACRRCQMVCVDQETGERRQEPLSTLAKTRRFDGKVFFGAHMRHESSRESTGKSRRMASIMVGQVVNVDP